MSWDEQPLAYALANITGSGFGGDLGYRSAAKLMVESHEWGGHETLEETETKLIALAADGEILADDHGGYSGLAVACQVCATRGRLCPACAGEL